jgi:hypothetical protein
LHVFHSPDVGGVANRFERAAFRICVYLCLSVVKNQFV